jgi:nitrite reductase/ring-hydroxylating ferredoxin subunit
MHGYVFELRTGELVRPKGLCANQRRFVTAVEGEEIVIWDPVQIVIR